MPRDLREIAEEDRIRLTHMLESARRASRIADGMTQASLETDEVRLLAIVKSIEIIGEASTKVSETNLRTIGRHRVAPHSRHAQPHGPRLPPSTRRSCGEP